MRIRCGYLYESGRFANFGAMSRASQDTDSAPGTSGPTGGGYTYDFRTHAAAFSQQRRQELAIALEGAPGRDQSDDDLAVFARAET